LKDFFFKEFSSSNCVGASYAVTTNTRTTREEIIDCNTKPACTATWSNWFIFSESNLAQCTVLCGGGTRKELSKCEDADGILSALCEGMKIFMRAKDAVMLNF